MSKLAQLSNKDVCDVLKSNGFVFERRARHGDLYVHPDDAERSALVPGDKSKKLKKGTLGAIIHDSKKPREDFTAIG